MSVQENYTKYTSTNIYTTKLQVPLNKGHLSLYKILPLKEDMQPLYSGKINWCQNVHYLEVPLSSCYYTYTHVSTGLLRKMLGRLEVGL